MKLKRIIAALFATALLLAPVGASESRASICPNCNRPSTWSLDCGGVNASQDEIVHCTSHGRNSNGTYKCKLTKRYGYTNLVCSNCGTHNFDIHLCQEKHSIDGISLDVCSYGGYPV